MNRNMNPKHQWNQLN
ncbi:hypothetical protein FQN60_018715 [Etheostoma spectabile]|uniref:Uncharacterized protein n=1 Tax=Etheostoma spectabile TaxID=54343 RepID=A0A5J5CDK7_9PERO|nr:hypothetical protein FQN60_018715 [Etheostoma spectabile]